MEAYLGSGAFLAPALGWGEWSVSRPGPFAPRG